MERETLETLETLKHVQGDGSKACTCPQSVMPNLFRHPKTLKQVQGDPGRE